MMPMGTSLSRWTMSYFAAALFFLLTAEGLLAVGGWTPSLELTEPRALIIVHSVTIGWLLLLMVGALLQFGPVLTGLELPKGNLGLLALCGIVAGLCLLLLGFHLLDLDSPLAGPTMAVAAPTLTAAIVVIAWVLAALLWRGRRAHEASRYVLLGIGSLAVTVVLGALFALTVSGTVATPLLVSFVVGAAPLHAGFGLIGWMTLAAIGVSYKLLPMFLLSNDMRASKTLRRGADSIVFLFGAAVAASPFDTETAHLLALLATLFSAVTAAAYMVELLGAYADRRRKSLEVNTYWSIPAFAMLAASAALYPACLLTGMPSNVLLAIGYLFVFGWLTGLGLAQLLKIVPFLTWIEAFGPLLGRRPTPRLTDLVNGGRASVWFVIFYISVAGAAAAIALNLDNVLRVAAFAQFGSTAAIAAELALARALVSVDADAKKSPFKHPAFFFAGNNRGDANGSTP